MSFLNLKTAAAAVTFAVATMGTAQAADVEIYGLIDEGLMFTQAETDGNVKKNTARKTHSFTQKSGLAGASRWGLKGGESLGNGYKINFVLEGKFNGDTGSLGSKNQLFDRDSYLELVTPYGSIQIGRTGLLAGGSHGGIFAGQTNPFGIVYKNAGAVTVFKDASQRASNMVRYESPSLYSVKILGQYSNGTGLETADAGNDALPSSQRDRYAALGVTFSNGGLKVALVGDYYFLNHKEYSSDYDNPRSVSLAANYDFGGYKIYGGYQRAENLRGQVFRTSVLRGNADIVMVGASADFGAGTLMAAAAYGGVKSFTIGKTTKELDAWQVSAGYKYKLSKRTMAYAAVSYRDADYTNINENRDQSTDTKTYQCLMGLQHKF